MPLRARIDELKASGELPSPSGVGLALLRLAQEEDASTGEIARVIKSDPALTGRILKQANSATYASYQSVATINEAVKRLGIRAVTQLALGFSLLAKYRDGRCEAFNYSVYWSRSLAIAVASRIIAHHKGLPYYEEMFTCGLLSKIGWLGLACVHPEKYSQVLRTLPDGKLSTLTRMERESFGIDHNDLSAALMEDWGIPEMFIQGIRFNENTHQQETKREGEVEAVASILGLARVVADVCMAEESRREKMIPRIFRVAERNGIEKELLPELYYRIIEEWREWGELLGISTQESHTLSPPEEKAAASDPGVFVAEVLEVKHTDPADTEMAGTVERGSDGLRILILDDDPVHQKVIAKHLIKAGHEVRQALDGRLGLEMIVKELPDLIVTDWIMPNLNGIRLCRTLRSAKSTQHLYLIMLTSRDDEESVVEAFEAGVDDYIVKPFNPRTFLARVRAGQRIVRLKEQVEEDSEEIKNYAAKLSILNRKLQEASLTDPLTGLPNRRYAMELLKEIGTRQDTQIPLSCMIIDIDKFKRVNDTLGHDTGDIVLRETAATLKNTLRDNDMVCRFGGEEFIVICEDTNLSGALHLAERLRTMVEGQEVAYDGGVTGITVSIGVAERENTGEDIQAVIKAADRHLYEAKKSGRNRVCPSMLAATKNSSENLSAPQAKKVAV